MESSTNLFANFAFCNTSSVMSAPASTITIPLSVVMRRPAFLPSKKRRCLSSAALLSALDLAGSASGSDIVGATDSVDALDSAFSVGFASILLNSVFFLYR